MSIKYTLPKTGAEVNSLVDKAIKTAGSARLRIQDAAVGILYHAYKHGDYTGANRLLVGLADKGIRRESLVAYFEGFGGLILNEDKATVNETPFTGWSGKEHIEANFKQAKETFWDTVVKEKDPFVNLDLQTALMAVIKRFEKTVDQSQKPDFNGKVSFELTGDVLAKISALSQRPAIDTSTQDAKVMDALDKLLSGTADTSEGEANVA